MNYKIQTHSGLVSFVSFALPFLLFYSTVGSANHLGKRVEYSSSESDSPISATVLNTIEREEGKSLIVQTVDGIQFEGPIEKFSFPETLLIVIDMQPAFLDSFKDTSKLETLLENISTQLRKAIQRGNWIVFVEFTGLNQSTDSKLLEIVEYYDRVIILEKNQNDGSSEIKEILSKFNINPSIMKICGVNTSACVVDTVLSLEKKFTRIRHLSVLADSCANSWGGLYHRVTLERMSLRPKIKVIF